jgi:hypothetical protein
MKVWMEVWPLSADKTGLWLLDEEAWRASVEVMSDADVHAEAQAVLSSHGVDVSGVRVLHSTSWRQDGAALVLTYMAVVPLPPSGLVQEWWPQARPVGVELVTHVGRPRTHAAAAAPTPAYLDVLLHGLRHLRHLLDTDITESEAMGPLWHRHLEPLRPALAGLYSELHQEAA